MSNELIERLRGVHVLVYVGDGRGRPAEMIFSSGSAQESNAICDTLLQLLAARSAPKKAGLEEELRDAWEGEGNSSRISFQAWLTEMAQNDRGTLQQAARQYLASSCAACNEQPGACPLHDPQPGY